MFCTKCGQPIDGLDVYDAVKCERCGNVITAEQLDTEIARQSMKSPWWTIGAFVSIGILTMMAVCEGL